MAKLQFYRQRTTPQVIAPDVRGLSRIQSPLAQAAEAISAGAIELGQITQQMDELKAEDAFNKLRERQTDLMMNPETGFSSKRAADAVTPDFISNYSGDFDKAVEEIASGLNGRQQQLFRRRSQAAKLEFEDSLTRHVLRETNQYSDNVYRGAIATETDNAIRNWNNPVKVQDSISRIAANTALWADRNGITGDALIAAQMENIAALHSAVVTSALDNKNVEYAEKYIEQNRNMIRADKLVDLEEKISNEKQMVKSKSIADEVIASFRGRIPTETEVRQMVRDRAGDNVDVRNDATSEALAQLASLQRDQKTREDNALSAAYRQLEQNGGDYMALPSSLRSAIPGEKIGTVRNFANSLRSGKEPETDWDTYYKLRTNPALLAQTNLYALKPALNDVEFKELVGLQLQAQEQPTEARTQVQTTKQRMDMRLAEMGIDPTPKEGTKAAKRVAQVWSMLDTNVIARESALGRKLTVEERNAEIDRLFANVKVKGMVYGTNAVAMFELSPEDEVVTVEIPDFDRRQIQRALRETGKEATEENIQYYFQKAQGLIKGD